MNAYINQIKASGQVPGEVFTILETSLKSILGNLSQEIVWSVVASVIVKSYNPTTGVSGVLSALQAQVALIIPGNTQDQKILSSGLGVAITLYDMLA